MSSNKTTTTTSGSDSAEDHVVRQQCLSLCRQYVGGSVWSRKTTPNNNIVVKQLTGGQTHKVYLCRKLLATDVDTDADTTEATDDDKQLVIRLNAKSYCLGHQQDYKDYILAPLLAQLGLGPKIYGICPLGQVLKYYPHRHFNDDDMKNNHRLVEQLAKLLAQFHQLDVPISKHSDWVLDLTKSSLAKLEIIESRLQQKFHEYNCKNLQSFHLKLEIQWLIESLESYMSSTTTTASGVDTTITATADRFVLTHADFRCDNIWVVTDDDGSGSSSSSSSSDSSLMLSDFDHTSYGSRGLDFGQLFSEFIVRKMPIDFPDDQLMRRFIADYIRESSRLRDSHGSDQKWSQRPINSVDSMLNECKFFIIAYQLMIMFVIIIMIDDDFNDMPLDEKTSYAICEASIGNYIELKRKFISIKK
ncbi:choline/ethanolamine kinase-like [Oppia nitens]|uniref:choline/ethanolamine kinase-like n=1 Tax=Oppia nitens TaxID=1686743 RepID=UPI0023DC0B82|nr:choline/ethanolamine kinase-like [Oppia nitens]